MHVVDRLRNSQFLRHNAIFFLGSVLVGALNYLYYPVIGRLMEPTDFGEVQTLISLFLQFSIFLTVFSLVVVNIVANVTDQTKRNVLVLEFEKLGIFISLVLLLATFLAQSALKDFFQFSESGPFVMLALALVVTVPFTMRGAFLRGKQQFGKASISSLVGAAGKLAFSVGLVMAGLSTAGAIGGLVAAQALGCVLVVWWAYRAGLRSQGNRFALPKLGLLLPELKYGLLVLVSMLVITLQYSADVVVIKHFFDAHTAGLYAGVASVARIIFFLTASVAMVLMPSVKMSNTPQENRRFLLKSFILFGGLSLPVLALFALAPEFVVGLLMGSSYKDMAHLLPQLSLAICIISALNLFVSYYLSLRRYGLAAVTVLGALITYALMFSNHSSVDAVVGSLLAGSTAMLGILVIWISISRRKGGNTK
jgi:O-antigen/teichoic acid export membrane protein